MFTIYIYPVMPIAMNQIEMKKTGWQMWRDLSNYYYMNHFEFFSLSSKENASLENQITDNKIKRLPLVTWYISLTESYLAYGFTECIPWRCLVS